MKQMLALEQAFFGKDYSEEISDICNLAFSDHLLFKVKYNYISNIRDKIFNELVSLNFFKRHDPSLTPQCVNVKKEEQEIMSNREKIKKIIEKHCNTSYHLPYFPNLYRETIIEDSGFFRERLSLTMNLANEMEKLNDSEFKKFFEKHSSYEIQEESKKIHFGKNLAVVGVVPNHDKENFCHILCYYKTIEEIDLNSAFIDFDDYLPQILAKHPDIYPIMKKIADIFYETENKNLSNNNDASQKIEGRKEILVKKVLTKPVNSNIIFAVYSVSFLGDIEKERDYEK